MHDIMIPDSYRSGQRVLSGVNGEIKHGRLTAVMGPSGSGKTTFLTTLAGRANYGKTVGTIFLNKRPDSLTNYRKLTGFVPQEDVMLRELTVEQNIRYAALTRLPITMTDAAREKQIEKIIRLLGLGDIRHSIIGDELTRGISGGQRKRVNVALELVAEPVVLFLDEPTSGLDSSSSFEVCRVLQRVAHEMHLTVVAVIHQPRYEIYTMFDDVLLLAKGGHTVYLGETAKAETYFADAGFPTPPKVNPSDHQMDVISVPANAKKLIAAWAEKDGSAAEAAARNGQTMADSLISPNTRRRMSDAEVRFARTAVSCVSKVHRTNSLCCAFVCRNRITPSGSDSFLVVFLAHSRCSRRFGPVTPPFHDVAQCCWVVFTGFWVVRRVDLERVLCF